MKCVRCGIEPRMASILGPEYLCRWCHQSNNWATKHEIDDAVRQCGGSPAATWTAAQTAEARDYLVRRWDWFGGWSGRRRKAAA